MDCVTNGESQNETKRKENKRRRKKEKQRVTHLKI